MNAASIRCGWCRSCIMTGRLLRRASSRAALATISTRLKSRRRGAKWGRDARHRSTLSLHLPLEGGSRFAQRTGWGCLNSLIKITPPGVLRTPTLPLQGRGKRDRGLMTYLAKPKFHHPALPKNALGFTHRDYEGKISTLCAGCGHDSITASVIEACFELSIEPHRVAKISGIGCSS